MYIISIEPVIPVQFEISKGFHIIEPSFPARQQTQVVILLDHPVEPSANVRLMWERVNFKEYQI